jgi:hypothetical protein
LPIARQIAEALEAAHDLGIRWAAVPDDQELRPAGDRGTAGKTVVLNWFDELNARVPVDK